MSTPTGQLAALSYVVEATYGTDPGTGHTFVHHLPSTLGPRRSTIKPRRLGPGTPTTKPFPPLYVDGETVQQMSFADSVVGKLLGALGHKTVGTPNAYAIGGGLSNVPDNSSLTCRMNYGKNGATNLEWAAKGLKPTSWRITGGADQALELTIGWIGNGYTLVAAPAAVSLPADSLIAVPADVSTVTFGGTAMQCKSFEIIGECPKSGAERNTLGAFREPQPTGQAYNGAVSARFQVELTSDTGYNTVNELANFLAGTPLLGTVILGTQKINLLGGTYTGEWPALQEGVHEFAFVIECDSAVIYTT